MRPVAGRRWFMAALVLAVGAIVCQGLAKGQDSRGNRAAAQARAQAQTSGLARERVVNTAVLAHRRTSRILAVVSLGLILSAAGSWLVSRARGETRPKDVMALLILIYIISVFTFV
jgi:hypothetical protein